MFILYQTLCSSVGTERRVKQTRPPAPCPYARWPGPRGCQCPPFEHWWCVSWCSAACLSFQLRCELPEEHRVFMLSDSPIYGGRGGSVTNVWVNGLVSPTLFFQLVLSFETTIWFMSMMYSCFLTIAPAIPAQLFLRNRSSNVIERWCWFYPDSRDFTGFVPATWWPHHDHSVTQSWLFLPVANV